MQNPLDKWIGKYPITVQFQGTMIGIVFMVISMLCYAVYAVFYAQNTLLWKIFIVVNALCGVLILWSFFVTTYQQYQSYKEVMLLQGDSKK